MTVVRRTPGPAYANLQWRKPREVWRGSASDAMGISLLAVCCRLPLTTCLGSDRGGDAPGRPLAIGRTCVAQRRSDDEMAIRCGVRASMVIASREPAKESPASLSRSDLDHDVSILITTGDAAGRVRGEEPRWNLSMTIIRPPQHGHGCESASGLAASAQLSSPASGRATGTSSRRRARAILPARVPLANRP